MKNWLLLVLLWTQVSAAMPAWVQTSSTMLLPAKVSEPLAAVNRFPLFWWNFLVLKAASWETTDAFCDKLTGPALRDLVVKSACGDRPEPFREVLTDWATDQSLRTPAPSLRELKAQLEDALAKASLPIDPMLLHLLQIDPRGTYRDLLKRVEDRTRLRLTKQHGYFYDPVTERIVIPVQLNFPPSEIDKSRKFFMEARKLAGPGFEGVVGPHASTLANEQQVRDDVHVAGIAGPILLAVLAGLAIAIGRWRLLLLAPPVLVSTALTTFIIVRIFGGIHGLTLSFGPGIVGLVMDHGLHSCLNTRWKGAWKANWYGLLTTVVALVLMLFSSIPFLRQLMAFSIIGLFLGFGTYWVLHRHFTAFFRVEPLEIEPKASGPMRMATFLLFAAFAMGCVLLHPNFGMQQMDYRSAKDAELAHWLFAQMDMQSPLVDVLSGQPMLQAVHQTDLGVPVENVAAYLPAPEIQEYNLRSWKNLCHESFSLEEKTFFKPFWQSFCGPHRPRDLSGPVPAYLRDFQSSRQWLALWMPRDRKDAQKVAQSYPEASSLRDLIDRFQTILQSETAWMAPLSILIAAAFLWIYYQKLALVLLSIVPFFIGMGTFATAAMLFHFNISFITLIATVMIFGLSLDYGIFATNLFTGRAGPSPPGVWTSVVFAATITFFGFLPLVFCKHPVLVQLGQALVFGTAGTILGSVWSIPCLHDLFLKRRPR